VVPCQRRADDVGINREDDMKGILAALRRILGSVFDGFGRWLECEVWPSMLAAGRACTWAADGVIDAAGWVADAVLAIPARLLGRSDNHAGQATPAATQQTEEQIRSAEVQAERQISLTQTAKLVHRAVRLRASFPDKDLDELLDALPNGLGDYVSKLTTAEAFRLSETDIPALISHLSGNRPVPNVRTVADVIAAKPEQKPSSGRYQATEAKPEQSAVMRVLADRIRQRQPEQTSEGGFRVA
jgi:hypothetical protein